MNNPTGDKESNENGEDKLHESHFKKLKIKSKKTSYQIRQLMQIHTFYIGRYFNTWGALMWVFKEIVQYIFKHTHCN